MSLQRECPSNWTLDRVHVGELMPQEAQLVAEHLSGCSSCEARLVQRRLHFQSLRERNDFEAFLEMEVERHQALAASRSAERKSRKEASSETSSSWLDLLLLWRGWGRVAALSGVVLFLMALGLPKPETTERSLRKLTLPVGKSLVPAKGSLLFRALHFRKGAPYPLWLSPNQSLRAGDFIQFSYTSLKPRYLMVVGMNQSGESYVMIPFSKQRSVRVHAGEGKLPTDSSFELDDYVGLERFFCFYSSRSFSFQSVRDALRSRFEEEGKDLKKLKRVPGPWHVQSLLIHKIKK